MTDEHTVEGRPDSDLAEGRKAARALPQLRRERLPLIAIATAVIVGIVLVLLWVR